MPIMRGFARVPGLFRRWRKSKLAPGDSPTDFSASLKVFRQDGRVYLELLLVNGSDYSVWVEEASIVLSELEANRRTSISTGQSELQILQNIGADETLRVSPIGAIYDAAGRPQGKYSCLVFASVCYRIDNEWFNHALDTYRVEMGALTVLRLRRTRRLEIR
jgi:hypothetical protein